MASVTGTENPNRTPGEGFCFRFTPAEWRHLLEDPGFLRQSDNSCFNPRKLMGVPVVIVPDHGWCLPTASA